MSYPRQWTRGTASPLAIRGIGEGEGFSRGERKYNNFLDCEKQHASKLIVWGSSGSKPPPIPLSFRSTMGIRVWGMLSILGMEREVRGG